ncbi:MAG: hypothetical protein DMF77_00485 [Acidobacteria bacterium]|nr:MAG: hypothetical protein DMF77_00485 [Acidobacteriota bacterium]
MQGVFRWAAKGLLLLLGAVLLAVCGRSGNVSELPSTVEGRESDLSGIAGPPDLSQMQPVARVPRNIYASAGTAEALAFPGLNDEERAAYERGTNLFFHTFTPEEGVGPQFNSRSCVGCHTNSRDIPPGQGFTTTATVASRTPRQGPTNYAVITKTRLPPTKTVTFFGDFFPGTGAFDPLTFFGGPLLHFEANFDCEPVTMLPVSADPNLRGGIDPGTGLSSLGAMRGVEERAAPPYLGRGLMEAVWANDIVANDDPDDKEGSFSSLMPPPGPECTGDCVSGRHNENISTFVGGDPVLRVSRFALRANAPALIAGALAGTSAEIGLTSPFAPDEQPDAENAGRRCDVAGDPEIRAQDVLDFRNLMRLTTVPEPDSRLFEAPPASEEARDIQAGAALFGVDLDAFKSRMVAGARPVGSGRDAERGIAADRKLNCAACHIPIMRTGQSPAAVGSRHMSNKWVPMFSDLILHAMPVIRPSRTNPIPPAGDTTEIQRNFAGFALAGTGLAMPQEWRTPPLMAIGKIGPPFLHDARVFLNPSAPARTVHSASDLGVNVPLVVTDIDSAFLAAIELHDLPPPAPGCPQAGSLPNETCPAQDETQGLRSESRNTMQKWRALSSREQMQVVKFLKSL